MNTHTNQNTEETINQEVKDLYRALNESSIVAITDVKGTITFVNDKFCEISKYSREELLGQNHRILKSGYHTLEFYQDLWQTISSGKVWKGEIKNRAKDGTYYWVLTTIIPFLNEKGKPRQYVAIRTDITELKRIQEELIKMELEKARRLQLEAQEEAHKKSKFLDIAAHELRTPITVLSLLVQTAEKKLAKGFPLSDDVFSRLKGPVLRLNNLVTDLLDMSRIERGLVALNRASVDMISLIDECLSEFKVLAPDRQFAFKTSAEKLSLCIDPLRINQVLTNFIDNAIKYTKDGVIEVEVAQDNDLIRVSVKDQGPGIPKAEQKKLFIAFTRGSSAETTQSSGLGLGLSVCKGIINLHGGTIGVFSDEKKGSVFYFELPLNQNGSSHC